MDYNAAAFESESLTIGDVTLHKTDEASDGE